MTDETMTSERRRRYRLPAEERFWFSVQKSSACWLWEAAINPYGYGVFKVQNKVVLAHRYSYELHLGKIPKGKLIMHSCDNPKCVNPEHLSVGTIDDNMADRQRKKRHASGERHGKAVLSKQDVDAIREMVTRFPVTSRRKMQSFGIANFLARWFDVTHQHILSIVEHKTWRQ